MPRWVPVHEDIKVPVFKNMLYAIKILNKADKTIMPSVIIAQAATEIFSNFISVVFYVRFM